MALWKVDFASLSQGKKQPLQPWITRARLPSQMLSGPLSCRPSDGGLDLDLVCSLSTGLVVVFSDCAWSLPTPSIFGPSWECFGIFSGFGCPRLVSIYPIDYKLDSVICGVVMVWSPDYLCAPQCFRFYSVIKLLLVERTWKNLWLCDMILYHSNSF